MSSVTSVKHLYWVKIRWLTWSLINIPFLCIQKALSCFCSVFRVIIHLRCEVPSYLFCSIWPNVSNSPFHWQQYIPISSHCLLHIWHMMSDDMLCCAWMLLLIVAVCWVLCTVGHRGLLQTVVPLTLASYWGAQHLSHNHMFIYKMILCIIPSYLSCLLTKKHKNPDLWSMDALQLFSPNYKITKLNWARKHLGFCHLMLGIT